MPKTSAWISATVALDLDERDIDIAFGQRLPLRLVSYLLQNLHVIDEPRLCPAFLGKCRNRTADHRRQQNSRQPTINFFHRIFTLSRIQ